MDNRSEKFRALTACIQAKALDPPASAATAAQLDASTQGVVLYNVAATYALLATSGKDPAEIHARGAMSALARARLNGYFSTPAEVARLENDRDFDSLRVRPGFQALIADLRFQPTRLPARIDAAWGNAAAFRAVRRSIIGGRRDRSRRRPRAGRATSGNPGRSFAPRAVAVRESKRLGRVLLAQRWSVSNLRSLLTGSGAGNPRRGQRDQEPKNRLALDRLVRPATAPPLLLRTVRPRLPDQPGRPVNDLPPETTHRVVGESGAHRRRNDLCRGNSPDRGLPATARPVRPRRATASPESQKAGVSSSSPRPFTSAAGLVYNVGDPVPRPSTIPGAGSRWSCR